MAKLPLLTKFRVLQIRLAAYALELIGRRPAGRALIVWIRSQSMFHTLFLFLVGYRCTFSSFAEALACSARYIQAGHEHADDIAFHASMAHILRESDFPVLYYLSPLVSQFRRVFDLGGNVGNVFYSYQLELTFPEDLLWIVFDLPAKKVYGERLAIERNEYRIQFTDTFSSASGADLFLASGSLHYFERPLDQMLSELAELPRFVVINRSPFSSGDDLITIQDAGSYLVACRIASRRKFIEGMQKIGYTLRAAWPVYERRLWVPLWPDLSSDYYSGFFFIRK